MNTKIFQAQKNFRLGELSGVNVGYFYIRYLPEYINKNDFILFLEQKQVFCKFLVLTGKHAGKIRWGNVFYFKDNPTFKTVEIE